MSRSVCIRHTERTATARCFTCHKPLCDECELKVEAGSFCSKSCTDNYAKFNARFQSEPRPGLFALLRKLVVTCLFLAGLAVLAVFIGAKFLKFGFCMELLKRWGL